MRNLEVKLTKKFGEKAELYQHLENLPPAEVEYEKECIKHCIESGYKLSDLSLVFAIHQYLVKEENELKYGAPFLHRDEKDEKERFYIISDHSRRKDKKFY